MKQQRTPLPPLPINPTLPPKPDFTSFSFAGGIARQSKPSKLLSRMEQASLQIASAAIPDSAGPISQPDTVITSIGPSVQAFLEPSSFTPLLERDPIATAFDEAMEDLALPPGKKAMQDVSLPDVSRFQEPPNGHSLDSWIRNTALMGSGDIELHVKQVTQEWAQVARVSLQTSFTPAPPPSEPTFSSPLKQEPVSPPSTVKPPILDSSSFSKKFLLNEAPSQSAGLVELAPSGPLFELVGQEDMPMLDTTHQSSKFVDSCQYSAVPRLRSLEESRNPTETPTPTRKDVSSIGLSIPDQFINIPQVPVSTGPTLNARDKPNKGLLSVDTGKAKYNTHRDPSHEPSPPSASSGTTQRAPAVHRNRRLTPPPPIPLQSQERVSRGSQLYRRSASPLPRTSRPPVRGRPSRSPLRLRSSSPAPRGTYRSRYASPGPQSRSPPPRRLRDSPPHLYRARPLSSTSRHFSTPTRCSPPPPNRQFDYSRDSYYPRPPSRDYEYASSRYPEAHLLPLHEYPRSPIRSPTRERSMFSTGHAGQTFATRNEEIHSASHNSSRDVRMASYTRPTMATQGGSYKRPRDDYESALQNTHAEPVPKRQRTEQAIPDESMSTLLNVRGSCVVSPVPFESGVAPDLQPNQTTNKSQPYSRPTSPQIPTSERKGKLWNMFAGGLTKPDEHSTPNTAGSSTRPFDAHTETVLHFQQKSEAISQQPVVQISKAGLAERLGGVQSAEAGMQSTNRPSSKTSPLSRRISVNQHSPGPVPPTRKRAESRQETLAQRMSLEQPSGSHTLLISRFHGP